MRQVTFRLAAGLTALILGCAAPVQVATQPGDPDNDGVEAPADRCPEAAEDIDGFADDDGCPDLDNDDDGVLDEHDLCPNQPMILYEGADASQGRGCPDDLAPRVSVPPN